jgi:hypothetical protein
MDYKFCAAVLSSLLLFANMVLDPAYSRGATVSESTEQSPGQDHRQAIKDVNRSRLVPPRNTVEDYLDGAEEQVETDDQRAVIRQALVDMLHEPLESLREKRYPDYQLHPHKWPITEVLYRYFVSDPPIEFDDDEFFRDVKKPQAQKMIQKWLDHLGNPDGKNGPALEERP